MPRKKLTTVPEADAAYLRENHKTMTVPQMAKKLNRANVTVYGFMDALKLKPLGRIIGQDHHFRRKNRDLEKNLLCNRIENAKLKKQRI